MSELVGAIHYTVDLDTGRMIDGQRKVDRELKNTTGSLDQFGAKLTQVASAIGAYAAALYLIKQSDAFTKMTAQLKLATDSTRELAIAQADVKKIAQEAQADIGAVASLYAKVTSSTKEMGLAQSTVASITRSVSLALKVSGASAAESGAAIMQLGQAFASGVLRGDEFNSIAEAAPRLMKALADGIGVPIGQLRAMAEAGKLTSEVLANSLPKALKDLEQEAKQIQTISGAFQELKNEVMLFIGEQSTANGVVKVISGSIGALSDNLGLLAGVMATVAAVKFAVWLESIVTQTYATVAANRAMLVSNVATAQAQVVATAATSALTAARVSELRAAVLATQGSMALAVTTNGLIPAQARAAAAAEAHAVALGALSVAQRAASVSGAAAAGVLSLLGGPIGAIVTVLGLGATAWMLWGKSAEDSSKQAADAMEISGREIIASLDKQNAKLRERLALANAGNVDAAKSGSKDAEKLASTLKEINDLKAKGAALTGSDRIQLIELEGRYSDISAALAENKRLKTEIDDAGKKSKASEWAVKYATDIERVNLEVAKAKKELGDAFTPELEKRIREKIIPDKKPKATPDERFNDASYLEGLKKNTVDAYGVIDSIEQKRLIDNDSNLTAKKISYKTHEEAIVLIAQAASKDRQDLMAKEFQEYQDNARRADEFMADQEARADDREKRRQDAKTNAKIDTLQIKAQSGGLQDQENLVRGMGQADMAAVEAQRVEAARILDLEGMQIYADQKVAIEGEMNAKLQSMRVSANQSAMNSTQDIFNSLVSITKDAAGEQSAAYKIAFAAQKAYSIASAIVAIQTGIAAASANPWPMNLAAMASVAAATASIVSTISGTSVAGGRQYGGPVSAGSMYRVNETGAPEMFTAGNGAQYMMPNKSGQVTAADKVGSGTNVNIVVNNTASSATASASYDEQSRTVTIAVAEVASQIRSNSGPVWSAMRSSSNIAGRM